jgi:hypothetical protein
MFHPSISSRFLRNVSVYQSTRHLIQGDSILESHSAVVFHARDAFLETSRSSGQVSHDADNLCLPPKAASSGSKSVNILGPPVLKHVIPAFFFFFFLKGGFTLFQSLRIK